MSEEKQIEQEIGWYKVIFTILSAIDVSLFAWFVQNYEAEKPILLLFCFFGIVVITIGILVINKNVFMLLDKLKEL